MALAISSLAPATATVRDRTCSAASASAALFTAISRWTRVRSAISTAASAARCRSESSRASVASACTLAASCWVRSASSLAVSSWPRSQ